MSTKKRVVENSIFYIFSSILVKAIGFLMLPIFTYFLMPDDYGAINLANSFIEVAIALVAFSLQSGVTRYYIDYKDDHNKVKSLFSSVLSFVFLSGAVFTILGILLRNQLMTLVFKGVPFYPLVFVALLSLTFLSVHSVHQSILQGMQLGKKLSIINVTVFSLAVALKVFFIGVLKLGAAGVLMAQLIVYFSYSLYMILDLKRNDLFEFRINGKILVEVLTYSIPLMPHNLSYTIADFVSRVFLNRSGTLADVGLYSIAMQFGKLIDVVQSSVNAAFQPWFFIMMNKKDHESRKEIVNFTTLLLIAYSLIYMGIGLFSQEVVIVMTNERYLMSWTAIPILVAGFSLKSIYYFYANIVFYYKQAARKLFIATMAGSFADIILAYILIPLYGMYGAATGYLMARIVIVTIVILISRQYDDVGYRVRKMLGIILPSLLFMVIGLYFSYTRYMTVFSWPNFLYKTSIFLVYLGFIYVRNGKMINRFIQSGKIQLMFQQFTNRNKRGNH